MFSVTHKACELLKDCSNDSVVRGFKNHVTAVYPSIQVVLSKVKKDGCSTVIEGAHFYSQSFEDLRKNGVVVCPVLLVLTEPCKLKKRIMEKQSERSGGEGKDWLKNFKRIGVIQDFLIKDAIRSKINIVENLDIKDTIKKIKDLLNE